MNLRNTLLRISGAIQVLEEELAKEDHAAQDGIDGIGRLEKIPQSEPITE